MRWLRTTVILVVVTGLAFAVVQAVYTGPPTFPDPLTTRGSFPIPPGNFTTLAGPITGEDYIVGNYSVVTPPGTVVEFQVFNSSQYPRFVAHGPAVALWTLTAQSSGRIVFAAPYTDTFYLVFENPYPAVTGIALQVFATTTYESNVVIG